MTAKKVSQPAPSIAQIQSLSLEERTQLFSQELENLQRKYHLALRAMPSLREEFNGGFTLTGRFTVVDVQESAG